MNEERYSILGCSPAFISIILESILRRHGTGSEVTIVTNVESNSDLTFETPGILLQEKSFEEWEPAGEALALGVYRCSVKDKVWRFFSERFALSEDQCDVLAHPGSEIATSAALGAGCTIGPLVTLAPFANLDAFVTINRNTSVGHHTSIGRMSTVNPGVHVAGRCTLGAHVTVGIGSTVVDGVTIGDGTVVGAASLVTKDLPAGVVAYGSPAKIIREI